MRAFKYFCAKTITLVLSQLQLLCNCDSQLKICHDRSSVKTIKPFKMGCHLHPSVRLIGLDKIFSLYICCLFTCDVKFTLIRYNIRGYNFVADQCNIYACVGITQTAVYCQGESIR